MTRILHEAGTITVDPADGSFEVTLISEGEGSSARFPREFFTDSNAAALAESLSFPGHPVNLDRPEQRNPMTAIGSNDKVVRIVTEADGKLAFRSKFHPTQSDPRVGPYLAEFGPRLGLSIYSDSDGHEDPADGKWVAESLTPNDPYRSVDLVIAGGARGKFEKVSESLGLLTPTSATAGGITEEKKMTDEIKDGLTRLTTVVENLVTALNGSASADAQAQADAAAVKTGVAEALGDYDKSVDAILAAKLTESQTKSLRALAATGVDIAPHIEAAKAVESEVRKTLESGESRNLGESHLGGGEFTSDGKFSVDFGFGKVVN